MRKLTFYTAGLGLILLWASCSSASSDSGNSGPTEVKSQVTVATVEHRPMNDYVWIYATSTFQMKNMIRANTTGYLTKVQIQPGQLVSKGQWLFQIETNEARALGKALVDSLHYKGFLTITSPERGYVVSVDHQNGDYVQVGDPLCTMADLNSFVFQMDVPFELTPYVHTGMHCEVALSDGQNLEGIISGKVPSVDPGTQTQRFLIKVKSGQLLPENLVARVRILKHQIASAQVLPKTAVLSNEAESSFWIMKLINDSTAIQVPISKGLETKDSVQILSPIFSDSTRVLTSGNYGLNDTARVSILPAS